MKLLILIAPTDIHVERFTRHDNDWSILKNDLPFQKIESMLHCQILNSCISRLAKVQNLWQRFGYLCLFPLHLKLS